MQQALVAFLLLACVVMAAFLIRMRERAHDRLQAPVPDSVPLSATPETPDQSVTLMMPNDMDGSLAPVQAAIPLPQDPTLRAGAIINHLIASWHDLKSTHPVDASSGVESIFILPAPGQPDQQLAVVNFDGAFPQAQPSGIEPETLTLLAIIQTLHANFSSVSQVRFLVDGHERETLAGHADLTRTYLTQTALPQAAGSTP